MNPAKSAPTGLMRIGPLRRFWHLIERTLPFLKVAFSSEGIISADGRQLIWGKARRFFFSSFPPLARALQKRYGIEGGCRSCGASCQLLFRCPHWDQQSRLCSVYEDRPSICRLFPITPADIRDRDLVRLKKPLSCGFQFSKAPETTASAHHKADKRPFWLKRPQPAKGLVRSPREEF
jgi:hypothetical protein